MKLKSLALVVCIFGLAVTVAAWRQTGPEVVVGRLSNDNWDALVPHGKEVDAILGDYVLKNEHITAVIAEPLATRNANMTVRNIGGCLIDLCTNAAPSDQLSCFYPGRRKYPFRSAEGTVDEQSIDIQSANQLKGKQASVTVTSDGTNPSVSVTYTLAADARHLEVATRYSNSGDEPIQITPEDDVRADGGQEDMVKSPNGDNALFFIHDRFWGQAYGVQGPSLSVQSNNNGSRETVLKYRREDSEQTEVELKPGQSVVLTRYVIPAVNLLDVRARAAELSDQPTRPVEIHVGDGLGQPIPNATVLVRSDGKSAGSGRTDEHGRLATHLPPGKHQLRVRTLGVDVTEEPTEITVADAGQRQSFDIDLPAYRPGDVRCEVRDAQGVPVPCKVEFIPQEGTPLPNFGPASGEFAVRNIRYAPQGTFEQTLPVGEYEVIISRGPEYDAIFTEITIESGETTDLNHTLNRTVRTPGWISSDFHSHSSPSGDNTGSQLGRVLNLVCEHVEFAPCTEHNRISTYEGHIQALGVERLIATVSGMELTGRPLPLNHQNVFPMVYRPRRQDGGGPVTDVDLETQVERLALWDERSDKLIQQNHPDMGWLFYDRDGDSKHDSGYERSFPILDVVEIHPISPALRPSEMSTEVNSHGSNRIFNWLQLLNQGFRIYGVVNTDAHYNFHGSGGLRNWIQSSTDDPSQIDHMEMVRASEEGRLIMSNGPYLEVSARDSKAQRTVVAGQDLNARSKTVTLSVRVQTANWLDIDRVFVLINGKQSPRFTWTRKEHADKFNADGVVKFEQTVDIPLKQDAHLIVVTGHAGEKLGPVAGPDYGEQEPTALSNPIFVDVDGNGFQPNKDTLGHPLPVKLSR